jgi:hypothetical protein
MQPGPIVMFLERPYWWRMKWPSSHLCEKWFHPDITEPAHSNREWNLWLGLAQFRRGQHRSGRACWRCVVCLLLVCCTLWDASWSAVRKPKQSAATSVYKSGPRWLSQTRILQLHAKTGTGLKTEIVSKKSLQHLHGKACCIDWSLGVKSWNHL